MVIAYLVGVNMEMRVSVSASTDSNCMYMAVTRSYLEVLHGLCKVVCS